MLHRSLICAVLLSTGAMAQNTACHAPLPAKLESRLNLFNADQERWLGEAMAEQMEAEVRVIEDPELNAYVDGIVQRLLANAETRGLTIKPKLIESADVNAFTIADGRIYITRKLLVAAHSEDEVAGVIAHELGHALTGQIPLATSRRMRDILGITALGDRNDVFQQMNRLFENHRRKKVSVEAYEKQEEQEQTVADQMAIALLARAGYEPHSFANFWDRIAETKGKTGNAFTIFFGTTAPDSKRLRKILQQAAALPQACRTLQSHSDSDFKAWQNKAINFSFSESHRAALASAAAEDTQTFALNPPLRTSIQYVKFSPDGKYVLAQDESTVFVLTRQPFALKFHFEAPGFYPAMFTPDSRQVTATNRALRVEQWDIATEKQASVHELVRPKMCVQAVISPTGEHIACVLYNDGSDGFDLELREVNSGNVIAHKKNIYVIQTLYSAYSVLAQLEQEGLDASILNVSFSPDGRYLLAGRGNSAFAYDTQAHSELKIGSRVRDYAGMRFDWLGCNRIVGVMRFDDKKSGVVKFPSGEQVFEMPFSTQEVIGATKGDYALLGPLKDYALGVADLQQKKLVAAHQRNGIDIYNGVIAADTLTGDIALTDPSLDKDKRTIETKLPVSQLPKVASAYVSPDLRYLTLSLAHSAGVWDLTTGQRLQHIRPFSGAYIDAGGILYGDFPKPNRSPGAKHEFGRLVLAANDASSVETIDDEQFRTRQSGRLRLRFSHPQKKRFPIVISVTDAQTNRELWSRTYDKHMPSVQMSPYAQSLVLVSVASEQSAKEGIKSDAALQKQIEKMGDREQIFYFEVVDGLTGKTEARMLLDSGQGSFQIRHAVAVRDSLVVSDSANRMLIYSLKDGRQVARFVGGFIAQSDKREMIAMRTNDSELHLIDAVTGNELAHRSFSAPIVTTAFDSDGTRMVVLTSDQKYRILKIGTKRTQQASAGTN